MHNLLIFSEKNCHVFYRIVFSIFLENGMRMFCLNRKAESFGGRSPPKLSY